MRVASTNCLKKPSLRLKPRRKPCIRPSLMISTSFVPIHYSVNCSICTVSTSVHSSERSALEWSIKYWLSCLEVLFRRRSILCSWLNWCSKFWHQAQVSKCSSPCRSQHAPSGPIHWNSWFHSKGRALDRLSKTWPNLWSSVRSTILRLVCKRVMAIQGSLDWSSILSRACLGALHRLKKKLLRSYLWRLRRSRAFSQSLKTSFQPLSAICWISLWETKRPLS